MDRHKTQSNRHKTKEVFKSGSAKRKMAKEKGKKNEEVLAKSRRMTDFITKCNATLSTSVVSEAEENNDVENDDVDEQVTINNPRQARNQTEANKETNNDIGKWPEVLTSSDIDSCVKMDIGLLQNCDEDLFESKSVKQSDTGKGYEKGFVRKCHTNLF